MFDDPQEVPRPLILSTRTRRWAEKLRIQKAELDSQAAELLGRAKTPVDLRPLENKCAEARAAMQEWATAACAELVRMYPARIEAEHAIREAHFEYELTREPIEPDRFKTIVVTFLLLLVEALLTAGVLAYGGTMGPDAAMMYGLLFSFVNIAVAQTAGFGLRRALFHKRIELDQDEVRRHRRFGWPFFIGLLIMLAALVFAAARVRVTGHHDDIFTFTEVGFLDTFNDAISLSIVAIGIVWSVLNIWKGYAGYSDPMPGYADAWRQQDHLDETAEEVAESAIDGLEGLTGDVTAAVQDDTARMVKDTGKLARDVRRLDKRTGKHNAKVSSLCDAALDRQRSWNEARRSIRGEATDPDTANAIRRYFDGLKCAEPHVPEVSAALDNAHGLAALANTLLGDLDVECDRQIAAIEAALGRYYAAEPATDHLKLLST